MGQTIALNFESLQGDLGKINEAAQNIIDDVKTAITKVESLRTSGGVEDVTIAAISNKLEQTNKMLTEVPDLLQELSSVLKKKSEELELATAEAQRAILGE